MYNLNVLATVLAMSALSMLMFLMTNEAFMPAPDQASRAQPIDSSNLLEDYSGDTLPPPVPNIRPVHRFKVEQIVDQLHRLDSYRLPRDQYDWRTLGDVARLYRRAFDMYYDMEIHGEHPVHREQMAQRLTQMEQKLFPWLTEGPLGSAMGVLRGSDGQGIVITTGTKYAYAAKHSILFMRRLGCKLPIEVIFSGEDDLGIAERQMLGALPGVRVRDMQATLRLGNSTEGWENKPFAVLASSFREVILMDADVLFFQQPEKLLQMADYRETGALLFRDRTLPVTNGKNASGMLWMMGEIAAPFVERLQYADNRIFSQRSTDEIDSGVVVWDKTRALPAILLTAVLNSIPYKHVLTNNSYGDKESFWLAHEAVRLPFALGPGFGGALGTLEIRKGHNEICGGLFHPDDRGNALWINGGIGTRERSASLKISKLTHWAVDYSGRNVTWKLDGNGPCLVEHIDATKNSPEFRTGFLSERELFLAKKMAQSLVEVLGT